MEESDFINRQAEVFDLKDHYEVKLPLFEGPLDLLLHLIRKEEIDVYDIPIASITQKYLEYINIMQELNINVAGEFLEMAATLIYIKSKMLLPVEESEDELSLEDDPRMELVEKLLEYEKFKNIAQVLYVRDQMEQGKWSVPHIEEVLKEDEQLVSVTLFDIMDSFRKVMQKYENRIAVEMERDNITVAEKVAQIKEVLKSRKTIRLSSFIKGNVSRLHIVVLFLAVLELAKTRMIRVKQDELFTDIILIRKDKK